MRRVIADQAAAYGQDRQEHGGTGPPISDEPGTEVLDAIPAEWAEKDAATYVIDLLFSIPFSPNKLAFDEKIQPTAVKGQPVEALGDVPPGPPAGSEVVRAGAR